jgi:hypothetical protein
MEILSTFMPELWWLIPVITVVGLFRLFKPKIKGKSGEIAVEILLSRLDKSKYKVINNIMLNTRNRTSQIDHVIVSNYGLFVIETKNYSGSIYGKEVDYDWNLNGHTKINNPTKQNYGHVQVIKEALSEFKDINYIPIVVFTTNADLKVSTKTDVVYTTKLISTINKYNNQTISNSVKEAIYKKLVSLNIDNEENRKAHVQAIRKNVSENNNKVSKDICPKCGSQLVVRNGRYGKFKGCSGYPKCRFTAEV